MTDHTNISASEVNILQRGCDSLLAEVARLTQELDLSRFTLRELRAQQVEDFDRAAAAEARLATLTQELTSTEKVGRAAVQMYEEAHQHAKAAEARLATLTQERDNIEQQAQSAYRVFTQEQAAAEASLAALTAKVEKHEKRPWPGCKMLSLGDACTCALCEHDRKMAALTAALDGLEQEIRAQSSKGFIATQLSCWADRLAALRTPKAQP